MRHPIAMVVMGSMISCTGALCTCRLSRYLVTSYEQGSSCVVHGNGARW